MYRVILASRSVVRLAIQADRYGCGVVEVRDRVLSGAANDDIRSGTALKLVSATRTLTVGSCDRTAPPALTRMSLLMGRLNRAPAVLHLRCIQTRVRDSPGKLRWFAQRSVPSTSQKPRSFGVLSPIEKKERGAFRPRPASAGSPDPHAVGGQGSGRSSARSQFEISHWDPPLMLERARGAGDLTPGDPLGSITVCQDM